MCRPMSVCSCLLSTDRQLLVLIGYAKRCAAEACLCCVETASKAHLAEDSQFKRSAA